MILQLEQECLDVYKRKVDQTRKHKADLHQALAEGEAEISNLISTLGERESFIWVGFFSITCHPFDILNAALPLFCSCNLVSPLLL